MTAAEAGAWVRRRRARALTQGELGSLLGCAGGTLSHTETGSEARSREWWARADRLLGAGGELLRRLDAVPDDPEPDPVWPIWPVAPVYRPRRRTDSPPWEYPPTRKPETED